MNWYTGANPLRPMSGSRLSTILTGMVSDGDALLAAAVAFPTTSGSIPLKRFSIVLDISFFSSCRPCFCCRQGNDVSLYREGDFRAL